MTTIWDHFTGVDQGGDDPQAAGIAAGAGRQTQMRIYNKRSTKAWSFACEILPDDSNIRRLLLQLDEKQEIQGRRITLWGWAARRRVAVCGVLPYGRRCNLHEVQWVISRDLWWALRSIHRPTTALNNPPQTFRHFAASAAATSAPRPPPATMRRCLSSGLTRSTSLRHRPTRKGFIATSVPWLRRQL